MRFRRTCMISSANALDKIKMFLASDVDNMILDLEDGVPPQDKDLARENIRMMFKEYNFRNKERTIRVNSIGSENYRKDMDEVVAVVLPDSIRVPKCEYPEDILRVDSDLRAIEEKNGLPYNSIEIIAMIESPMGVRNAYEIASSSARLTALAIGMEDLTRDLRVTRRYENDELDLLYARQKLVLDARAAKVQLLDSSLLVLHDFECNIRHAKAAKQDGFDGRSVGDVAQVEAFNRIYSHSPESVAHAKGMQAAYEEQSKDGRAESFYEGKLVCFAAYEGAMALIKEDNERAEHASKLGLAY